MKIQSSNYYEIKYDGSDQNDDQKNEEDEDDDKF
jgi:hypothetical protein